MRMRQIYSHSIEPPKAANDNEPTAAEPGRSTPPVPSIPPENLETTADPAPSRGTTGEPAGDATGSGLGSRPIRRRYSRLPGNRRDARSRERQLELCFRYLARFDPDAGVHSPSESAAEDGRADPS